MLKSFKKKCKYHVQAAINSFVFLCKQPLTTSLTVIVIAVTLTLPALLWVFTDNVTEVTKNWERGGHISLYLDMQLSRNDSLALLSQVKQMQGVESAVFKSPEEGINELKNQQGMQDLMDNLPINPLPGVIDVTPNAQTTAPEMLEELHARLKALPGVENAELDMEWVGRLHALIHLAKHLTHGLMLLLALAVLLIIGNTLRLVIHKRHEEVQVLKLIGASESFIMRPFLYSGIWYGFAGALLALLLVAVFRVSLNVAVCQLAEAFQIHLSFLGLSLNKSLLLIFSATCLGWIGAFFSVKRQLIAIEPAGFNRF